MLIVLLLSVLEQGSAVALYSMGTLARSAHDWVGGIGDSAEAYADVGFGRYVIWSYPVASSPEMALLRPEPSKDSERVLSVKSLLLW